MLQKDYLLREIEKVGLILSHIHRKIWGRDKVSCQEQWQCDVSETLSRELNFNLDKFLALDLEDSLEYIESFKGFDDSNTELLANCLAEMGFRSASEESRVYLQKTLQVYEFLNQKTKTFSLERTQNMQKIRKALSAFADETN